MKLRCASCASTKKKKTATIMHEGDSLCDECYAKKIDWKKAQMEHDERMKKMEEMLAHLASQQAATGAKK